MNKNSKEIKKNFGEIDVSTVAGGLRVSGDVAIGGSAEIEDHSTVTRQGKDVKTVFENIDRINVDADVKVTVK